MRRAVAILGFVAVAVAAVPFVVVNSTPSAAKVEGPAVVMIPASDGYGLNECLTSGAACGKVVADAWCQAHGYGPSLQFGVVRPEEVTGSVVTTVAARTDSALPIAVTCQN